MGPGRAHIEAMPSYMPVMLALQHKHTLCESTGELCVVLAVHAVENQVSVRAAWATFMTGQVPV